jgi:hypothetical protein
MKSPAPLMICFVLRLVGLRSCLYRVVSRRKNGTSLLNRTHHCRVLVLRRLLYWSMLVRRSYIHTSNPKLLTLRNLKLQARRVK